MRRATILALIAAATAVVVGACGGGDDPVLSKVFVAPTWTGDERLIYRIRERDDVRGECVLVTDVDAEPGRTRLDALCGSPDGRYRDDRSALIDSKSLLPISSTRSIRDQEKGEVTTFTTVYEYPVVRLTADDDGDINNTTRDLPEPDERSSDPGYYDDESLNWLVRGIPLHEGFQGAYRNVNAGTAKVVTVKVEVEEQEGVEVPAGTFRTWKVVLRTESITQLFWVDVEAPHRVIKARIENVNYELTRVE